MINHFKSIYQCLLAAGKKKHGEQFQFDEIDMPVVEKVVFYILRDEPKCKELGIVLEKGILLTGPVGCGKTSLFKIIKAVNAIPIQIFPAQEIAREFAAQGFKTIDKYGKLKYSKGNNWIYNQICIDDIGSEGNISYYKDSCNVIEEVLITRYDQFIDHNVKTFGTSNFNADEIEERYGLRVRSRCKEMFNLIAFDKDSRNKRV
ncbi:MAG: hypothetical protein POELPBGB_00800 [Bacteroidia bacterium]|nr:hypothetical protein [Bacteroidia bacterium]